MAWVANFLHQVAGSCYAHFPGFLKNLGASELMIGTIFSVTALGAILVRPGLGSALDVYGRRPFIIAGGAIHACACALYLGIGRIDAWVFALRVVQGLSEAVLFSGVFTYAADIVPGPRRTEGMAWFGVSALLPVALGGLAGDFVLAHGTYRHLFLLTALLSALGTIVSLSIHDPRSAVPKRRHSFVTAALRRNLTPLWFVGVVFATAIAPIFTFLKTFVMQSGVGSVGLFLAFYAFGAAALRVVFGWVPDRIGPKRVLLPAVGTVSVGLLLLSRAATALEVGLAGGLVGLGHGFAFPILVGLAVERARPGERGVAVSVATAIFDAGLLIGGPLFGAIIEAYDYAAAYVSAAALAAGGLVVFAIWDRAVLSAPAAEPESG